jgi:glutathione S-transferase
LGGSEALHPDRAPARLIVYGSKVSYFTGKFETYLRYKGIRYRFRPLDPWRYSWVVPRKLGATQLPTVRLDDGRWMSDTTPMIAWLEQRHPEPVVIPADPVQRYMSLLVEDYADEWLWRPAMHYRWSYDVDRHLAATRLARELLPLPLPLAARRSWIARRQMRLFVTGDGIDERTRAHAESAYANALALLEPIVAERPFLFGERPTIADIGLMAPFWRHFVHDPTPARLMQDRAPAVFEWAARTWNARASRIGDRPLLDGVPNDWSPLLREIGATHLEALSANAFAHRHGMATHDVTIQGTTYRDVPTSAYRVWCLEQLRARFEGLASEAAERVREVLSDHGGWEPLWRVDRIASGHDPAGTAPFCRAHRMVRD